MANQPETAVMIAGNTLTCTKKKKTTKVLAPTPPFGPTLWSPLWISLAFVDISGVQSLSQLSCNLAG